MSQVFTFGSIDAIRAAQRKWWAILPVTLVVGVGSYFGIDQLPKFYGYTALIDAANIETAGAGDDSSGDTRSHAMLVLAGDPGGSPFKKEALSFIKFKYLDIKRDFFSPKPYLKDLDDQKGTNLLSILTYGATPQEAKNFAEQILSTLQDQAESKLKASILDTQNKIRIYEAKRKQVAEAIDTTARNIKQLGYTSVLDQQRTELQRELFKLDLALRQMEFNILPTQTYNFKLRDLRPFQTDFISPKIMLLSIAAGVAAFLFMTILVVLYAEEKERREYYASFRDVRGGPIRIVPPPFRAPVGSKSIVTITKE